MLEKEKLYTSSRIEQIYIAADDSNLFTYFKTYTKNEDVLKIKMSQISNLPLEDELKIVNGISYLNLETLKIIDKNLKQSRKEKSICPMFKMVNKERLATIFKCLGFNIIYCHQFSENIFNELGILTNLKYEYIEISDCIKTSVIVMQNIFYDLAKKVIQALTGTKCRISKYFNLSYLIISKYKNKFR